MSSVGNMQEEAEKRKERLAALRNKKKGESDTACEKKQATDREALPKPVFRSYKPQDEGLKEAQLPSVKPTEVTEHVKDQLDASKPQPLVEEIDLVNLAPRKPDWDLKRDVAKKLEKLERRTQRAIAELIRDRLQSGKEDLVTAVNVNIQATQVEDDED